MPRQRPNIMLLVGEDTGLHLGCYGHDYATTPNLDKLAAEGCRYTNAITHAPVCAPSRSGLVTGRYPWTYGSHHMRSTCLHPPRVFTQELRDAGVATCWPTKTDFNFEPPADFVDSTEDWLARGELPREPFFVYRNFGVTHESCVWDGPNHDGYGFARRVADLAPEERHDPADAPVPPYLPDTPEVREDIARYHDLLALQDRQVGRALDLLDRSGASDRTVVIYLTDHGRGLPREKRWCYDAGLHLPLVIRGPGIIEPGTTCDDLIAWVDIAPTILSLMGVPIPSGYHGQAFLGPERGEPRRFCYAGRDRIDENYEHIRVVRSARHLYIRNYSPQIPYMTRSAYMDQGPPVQALRRAHREGALGPTQVPFMEAHKPAEELFDIEADPDCVHNVADAPGHRVTLSEMRMALEKLNEFGEDFGVESEEHTIARGVVADRLDEYRAWIKPQSLEDAPGRGVSVITAAEAIEHYGSAPQPALLPSTH